MVFRAALTAARPNSSLKAPGMGSGLPWRNSAGARSRACGGSLPWRDRLRVVVILHRRESVAGDFGALEFLPSRIPSSTRVHASGPNRRPAARRRSASTASPLRGLGSSRNKFEDRGKERRSNFFRAPPRKHSLALGSRAHSLASRRVTRAAYGKFNETEITTMYSNKVTLIGFLGNDAEVRTNNDRSLTTLAGNQELLQEGRQVHRANRMAPLRRLRKAWRVCRHAQEGRTRPRRRRAAQPQVREYEDQLGADHLGDPGGLDSQAGSRGQGRPGRQRRRSRGRGRIGPSSFPGSPASSRTSSAAKGPVIALAMN